MTTARKPTLAELAGGFALLALRGVGGVAPQARQVIVVERGWLDEAEFASGMGLGQVLPGANIVNLAAMIGDRYRGPLGACVSVAAILLPSTCIAFALLAAIAHVQSNVRVVAAERYAVAAAGGLAAATGVRIVRSAAPGPISAGLAVAATLAIVVAQLPLPVTVAGLFVAGWFASAPGTTRA